MEYSKTEKKEIMKLTNKWVELEDIIPSEVTQTKMQMWYVFFYM